MTEFEVGMERVTQKRPSAFLDWDQALTEVRLVPNLISMLRLVLVLPVLLLYPLSAPAAFWTMLVLLTIQYLSDYADGYFARKLNQRSRLGLILDPVADKTWTVVMMILLCRYRDLPVWIGITLVGRDILILAMNYWSLRRVGVVMASDELGRKYVVILGLMIIGLTLRIRSLVWLGYPLVLMAAITAGNYYRNTLKLNRGRL